MVFMIALGPPGMEMQKVGMYLFICYNNLYKGHSVQRGTYDNHYYL